MGSTNSGLAQYSKSWQSEALWSSPGMMCWLITAFYPSQAMVWWSSDSKVATKWPDISCAAKKSFPIDPSTDRYWTRFTVKGHSQVPHMLFQLTSILECQPWRFLYVTSAVMKSSAVDQKNKKRKWLPKKFNLRTKVRKFVKGSCKINLLV